MALKAVLDTLDELPEELRAVASLLYREDNGKFKLDADEVGEAGRRAIEHERRQRADAIKAREVIEAKVADLEAKLQAAAASPPNTDGATAKEAERLKREYDERLKAIEAKLQSAEEQRQQAEQKLAESSISDALRGAALELGVPKESVEDLIQLPRFRQPWKMTDQGPAPFDGDLPRMDPDAPGRNMAAKSYVREYLKENKHWLPPSTGSAAQGGAMRNAAGGGVMTVSREQMRDHAQYNAITQQAQKIGATIQITD